MKTKHIIQICILVAVTMLFIAPSYAALTDGLVSYWTFDDADLSGSDPLDTVGSNNGDNYGATISQTGKVGQAFDFDGDDDYIDTGTSIWSSGNHSQGTVVAWVRVASLPPSQGSELYRYPSIVCKGNVYATLAVNDYGKILITSYGGASYSLASIGSIPGDNSAWAHVAVRWDGSGSSIYLNGSFDQSGAATWANMSAGGETGPFWIGATQGIWLHLDALIDDVAIWNRVLDAGEVELAYNTGLAGNPLENPIPEPISCIGFVLGIAGLAVRRKFE